MTLVTSQLEWCLSIVKHLHYHEYSIRYDDSNGVDGSRVDKLLITRYRFALTVGRVNLPFSLNYRERKTVSHTQNDWIFQWEVIFYFSFVASAQSVVHLNF